MVLDFLVVSHLGFGPISGPFSGPLFGTLDVEFWISDEPIDSQV